MQVNITNGTLINTDFNSGKNYVLYDIYFVANAGNASLTLTHSISKKLLRFVSVYAVKDNTGANIVPPVSVPNVSIVPSGTSYERTSVVNITSGLTSNYTYKVEVLLFNDDQG